ncbi:MAG: hypothetical protein AAF383_02555 [Cyanobacteria bacterium P01_A01_bin.83]
MTKIIYVSSIALTLFFPKISFASNNPINTQDFKYLVCSYIQDSITLDDALIKIENVLSKFDINQSQEETLYNLGEQTINTEDYCQGLEF